MKGQKTGGRQKGTPNKATVERALRAAHGVEAAVNSGLLPLDIMLRVMRGDTTITAAQFAAAVAAAPYIHARLASASVTHIDPLERLTDDELNLLLTAALRQIDHPGGPETTH